jgi:hypothetical protein
MKRILFALLAALPAAACSHTAASTHAKPVEQNHDGFWWTHLGSQSVAVANFGPTIELADGLYRQWSLIIHLPGTPEPVTCLQGLVPLVGDNPIAARGEYFAIELRPREHHLWGDVREDDQLAVTAEGLY